MFWKFFRPTVLPALLMEHHIFITGRGFPFTWRSTHVCQHTFCEYMWESEPDRRRGHSWSPSLNSPDFFFCVWGSLRMNCTVYHYLGTVMLCWKVLQAEVEYIASYMLHWSRKVIHYGWNIFLATYVKPSGFETLMTIFIYCSWVSSRWQWFVNLYKNRKEGSIYRRETIHNTI